MNRELERFPTLEEIRKEYPNPMTVDNNSLLVDAWKDSLPEDKLYVVGKGEVWETEETDEQYPHCNYCVGGALHMAFDVHFEEDRELGSFPRVNELAETLHYFCNMPYASVHNDMIEYDCPFHPEHENRKCFNTDDSEQTAIDLASAIIDANDSERYEEAWEYVGQALDTKKKGIV